MRKFTVTIAAIVALLAVSGTAATAHTGIVDRSPSQGATVGRSVGSVWATFGQVIRGGRIRVYRSGSQVAAGGRDRSNARRLAVRVGRLAKGKYSVGWRMKAADGHTQRGTWSFRVR